MHFGKPSYTIKNDNVEIFITVQGGHMTGSFKHGDRDISPFFVSPWSTEHLDDSILPILQVMRGDYFCFPFGINADAYKGVSHPLHGKTANHCWDFVEIKEEASEVSIRLSLDLSPAEGKVDKVISLRKGAPIIYNNHTITGFSGKFSFGNHPNIQCPDKTGSAIIDMTKPIAGFTAPMPINVPEGKGYALLKPNAEITDISKIPTVYNDFIDLRRYPMPKGFEDVVIFVNDPSKDFTFSAVTIPEEEFLYFQLKDPKVSSETLLWMLNGGNFNPPFDGRGIGVLGVEEVTGYFFYGIIPSIEKNPMQEKGYRTYAEMTAADMFEVKLINGLIPVDKGFKGVENIVKKDSSTITIMGRGGEKIDVACDVDFLRPK
jgi:hypothetical protein